MGTNGYYNMARVRNRVISAPRAPKEPVIVARGQERQRRSPGYSSSNRRAPKVRMTPANPPKTLFLHDFHLSHHHILYYPAKTLANKAGAVA